MTLQDKIATLHNLIKPIDENVAEEIRIIAKEVDALTTQLSAVKAERDALKRMLREASEDIADWGAYASNYFQEKHNLAGDIKKYADAATESDTKGETK